MPLLLFLTPGTVEAHSAVKKPEREESGRLFAAEPASLIPTLNQTAEALESARLVRAIETGQFFLENAQFFPPNEAVDRCLVENLVHTAKRLKATSWILPRAHALLGRALFVTFRDEVRDEKGTTASLPCCADGGQISMVLMPFREKWR